MPKRKSAQKISKKQIPLTANKIEKLLNEQTAVILGAVDEKIGKIDQRMGGVEGKIEILDQRMTGLEKKLEKMEIRINQKIDRLLTSLDKFLKKLTDLEDEFTIMKADINRMKKVIKVKLGIDLL